MAPDPKERTAGAPLRRPAVAVLTAVGLTVAVIGTVTGLAAAFWPPLYGAIVAWKAGIGAFAGAAIGFYGLMAAALYNAALNRRRDDDIRAHERATLAAAFLAQLRIDLCALEDTLEQLNNPVLDDASAIEAAHEFYWLPRDISAPLSSHLGALGATAAQQITKSRVGSAAITVLLERLRPVIDAGQLDQSRVEPLREMLIDTATATRAAIAVLEPLAGGEEPTD